MKTEIDLFWEMHEFARQVVQKIVYEHGEKSSENITLFQSYADIIAYDLSMLAKDPAEPMVMDKMVGKTIGYCKRGNHYDILLVPATIEQIEKDASPKGKKIIIPAAIFSIKYNHHTGKYSVSSKPHIKHSFPLSLWHPWFFSLYQDLERAVFQKASQLNMQKV